MFALVVSCSWAGGSRERRVSCPVSRRSFRASGEMPLKWVGKWQRQMQKNKQNVLFELGSLANITTIALNA